MQKKYFVTGLPASAQSGEVGAFLSLFGPVASFRLCDDRLKLGAPRHWLVEMMTDEGASTLMTLSGEGYTAKAAWMRSIRPT